MHLKFNLLKSSAATNCITLLTNLSIEANSVGPDQAAPTGYLLNVYKIAAKKGHLINVFLVEITLSNSA